MMHRQLSLFLIVIIQFLNHICSFNYDVDHMDVITQNAEYFGYSVLLQTGITPGVVIGAPKANQKKGSVFKCTQNNTCHEIVLKTTDPTQFLTEQFIGASIDGSDDGNVIIICAPKATRKVQLRFFTNGICYKINKTSTQILKPLFDLYKQSYQINLKTNVYNYWLGEAGFSSLYNSESNEIILGAPGVMDWRGTAVKYLYNSNDNSRSFFKPAIPNPLLFFFQEPRIYFGYSLSFGKFHQNSNHMWYISGAPRGHELNGIAYLFDFVNQNFLLKHKFYGTQRGSYFGASVLAADVTKNGAADVFIGAPTYMLKEYDEGAVFYYKNNGNGTFDEPLEIFGAKLSSGQFGTAISSIGDIDLDGYNDIAISAPNAFYGEGAVYIYLGGKNFQTNYVQILRPKKIASQPVKAFGFTISRGGDIDMNQYPDIAIGAYASKQVFIAKTCTVIAFQTNITSSLKEINVDTQIFTISFCLSFTEKTQAVIELQAEISAFYHFDDSLITSRNITVHPNYYKCETIPVNAQKQIVDLTTPLTIKFAYKKVSDIYSEYRKDCSAIKPHAKNTDVLQIPYAHGCGDDKVCQVNLKIAVEMEIKEILVGKHEKVKVLVNISNAGPEPAYFINTYLYLDENIGLVQIANKCNLKEHILNCVPTNKLSKNQTVSYEYFFDLDKLSWNAKSFQFSVTVNSSGFETAMIDNAINVTVPLYFDSNPKINGISNPSQLSFEKENTELLKFNHEYSVTNTGPSPYNVLLEIFVPISINKIDFIQFFILDLEQDIHLSCTTELEYEYIKDLDNINKSEIVLLRKRRDTENELQSNRFIEINCDEESVKCAQVRCFGKVLFKPEDIAKVKLNIIVNITVLNEVLANELKKRNIIIYRTKAKSSTNSCLLLFGIETELYGNRIQESVDIWVILVSVFGGLLLLTLAALLLYKLNFFRRGYKEMIESSYDETEGSSDQPQPETF